MKSDRYEPLWDDGSQPKEFHPAREMLRALLLIAAAVVLTVLMRGV